MGGSGGGEVEIGGVDGMTGRCADSAGGGWRSWVRGVSLAVGLLVPAAVAAQPGTAQEQEACQPDVFRLCSRFIPDVDNIVACLNASGPRLSPACHAVMFPRQADPPRRKVRRKHVRS
ncbi:hypothetical protein [Bradyrhizobium sp. 2TAF24]|uniref:hypothetical protein n=1 Tax=Bradyrhizobium sp. 2TAF24 TaxID=3233011 RepID=UPI003F92709E